jgi:hypothetical protein
LPPPANARHQAVAVAYAKDGADCWQPHLAGQPASQPLADLARAPMVFFALEPDNQSLNLGRERIGVMHRPAGAILKRSQPSSLQRLKIL